MERLNREKSELGEKRVDAFFWRFERLIF